MNALKKLAAKQLSTLGLLAHESSITQRDGSESGPQLIFAREDRKFWEAAADAAEMTDAEIDAALVSMAEKAPKTEEQLAEERFRDEKLRRELDYCKRELAKIAELKKKGVA